jgi:hypothetical protein
MGYRTAFLPTERSPARRTAESLRGLIPEYGTSPTGLCQGEFSINVQRITNVPAKKHDNIELIAVEAFIKRAQFYVHTAVGINIMVFV